MANHCTVMQLTNLTEQCMEVSEDSDDCGYMGGVNHSWPDSEGKPVEADIATSWQPQQIP